MNLKLTNEEAVWLRELLEDMDVDSLSDEGVENIMRSLHTKLTRGLSK